MIHRARPMFAPKDVTYNLENCVCISLAETMPFEYARVIMTCTITFAYAWVKINMLAVATRKQPLYKYNL